MSGQEQVLGLKEWYSLQVPEQHLNMEGWRNLPVVSNDRKVRKVKAVLLMYVAWNLKRGTSASSNHQLRSMQPSQILQEIKSALRTRTVACGSPALPPFLSMFSSVSVEFECLFVFLFVISVCNLNSYSLASSLKWQCSATANFSKKQKRWGHPLLVAPSCIPNKIKADRTYFLCKLISGWRNRLVC